MFDVKNVEIEWAGRTLKLETGKIARQADSTVIATYGGTTVMCNVVAAKEAIKYVKNNMKLGLGTGSTVDEFLKLLSAEVKNGLDIFGVVTSEKTKVLSESLGIPLTTLSNVKDLDLTIDGADEIDPDLSLIKGGGGALLREKIIAYNSKELIIIADKTKLVSAFHVISEKKLINPTLTLDYDIFVAGDSKESTEVVNNLINEIEGLRPIYLGPGALAYLVEMSTPLLLNAMIRNKMKNPGIKII